MVTQAEIDEKLANAQENGYWCDETLGDTEVIAASGVVEAIVTDLQELDVDCENLSSEELTPLVQAWYDARRKIGEKT